MIPGIRMVNLSLVSGNLIDKIVKDKKNPNNYKEPGWSIILRKNNIAVATVCLAAPAL